MKDFFLSGSGLPLFISAFPEKVLRLPIHRSGIRTPLGSSRDYPGNGRSLSPGKFFPGLPSPGVSPSKDRAACSRSHRIASRIASQRLSLSLAQISFRQGRPATTIPADEDPRDARGERPGRVGSHGAENFSVFSARNR